MSSGLPTNAIKNMHLLGTARTVCHGKMYFRETINIAGTRALKLALSRPWRGLSRLGCDILDFSEPPGPLMQNENIRLDEFICSLLLHQCWDLLILALDRTKLCVDENCISMFDLNL